MPRAGGCRTETSPPWLRPRPPQVLGWALGRGPLAQPLPFRPFLAYMAAPALPAPPGTAAFRLDARAALAKAAALAAAAQALACRGLPPWLHGALQSIALFCFTSLGMEGAACVASLLSGRPARVPFARPYAAASVGDFWRRWNVVPGVKFRQLLYDPLCQPASAAAAAGGAGGRRHAPSPWRRAAGACAVFAASGAVHELAHWYLTGGRLSGAHAGIADQLPVAAQGQRCCRRAGAAAQLCTSRPRRCRPPARPIPILAGWWMLFFALQGPLVCVEALLLTLCRQAGVRMPQAARTAATLLLLHASEWSRGGGYEPCRALHAPELAPSFSPCSGPEALLSGLGGQRRARPPAGAHAGGAAPARRRLRGGEPGGGGGGVMPPLSPSCCGSSRTQLASLI